MTLIAIACNDDRTLAHGQERDRVAVEDVLKVAASVERACAASGARVETMLVSVTPGDGLAWMRSLQDSIERIRPDVIFNLVESVGGDSRLEAAAAWVLEASGIPYTGSPPRALTLAVDKPVTRALLAGRGIPVAAGCVLERGDEPLAGLRYPLIVKPSREDASHGIDGDSVVHDEAAARRQVLRVIREYRQAALVEEFVEGREINASILGEGESLELLPLAEIDFSQFPAGGPKLVTYEAKWDPTSAACLGTPSVEAGAMSVAHRAAIAAASIGAYRALGLRDYGRVDLRLHPVSGPVVLEINANPDISEDAGLGRTAARAGIAHRALVERVVEGALRRGRRDS